MGGLVFLRGIVGIYRSHWCQSIEEHGYEELTLQDLRKCKSGLVDVQYKREDGYQDDGGLMAPSQCQYPHSLPPLSLRIHVDIFSFMLTCCSPVMLLSLSASISIPLQQPRMSPLPFLTTNFKICRASISSGLIRFLRNNIVSLLDENTADPWMDKLSIARAKIVRYLSQLAWMLWSATTNAPEFPLLLTVHVAAMIQQRTSQFCMVRLKLWVDEYQSE